MQRENAKPVFRTTFLILLGSTLISAFTILGMFSNPGDLIREDVRLGPVIAASKILIPLFGTIGMIYFLSSIKKCEVCGKLIFWNRKKKV
ncbi:MAG: hypothetical protein HQL82_08480 [Magnetococcales bacterium]|nr:hypothetical protein [Magnetococcales bacterium]